MNLQEAARNYERNVSQYLQQMLRAGSANVLNPQGIGQTRQAGSNTLMYGTTPSSTQVKQWIAGHGGNPYTRELMAQGGRRVTRRENALALNRAGAQEQSTLQQFIDQAQSRYDEANAANKERYADILQRLEGRYERNMARVDNWGLAAEGDARERAAEAFGNVQANLSARGLGNASIADAFRQRNARDLDRNLQQISEQRDSRAAQYDQALSKDVTDFMASRYDNAPKMSDVIQLAQLQAQRGPQQAMTPNSNDRRTTINYNYAPPQASGPMMGGVSPGAAMAMAAGMQAQLSPLYGAAYGPRIGYVPNQYYSRDRQSMDVEEMAARGIPLDPVQLRVLRERQALRDRIARRRQEAEAPVRGPMGPFPEDYGPTLPEYPLELMPSQPVPVNQPPITVGYPAVDAGLGSLMGAYGGGVGPAAAMVGQIAGNMAQAYQMDQPRPIVPPMSPQVPAPINVGFPPEYAGALGQLAGAYGYGMGSPAALAGTAAALTYQPPQDPDYTLPIPVIPIPFGPRGGIPSNPPRPPALPPREVRPPSPRPTAPPVSQQLPIPEPTQPIPQPTPKPPRKPSQPRPKPRTPTKPNWPQRTVPPGRVPVPQRVPQYIPPVRSPIPGPRPFIPGPQPLVPVFGGGSVGGRGIGGAWGRIGGSLGASPFLIF